MHDRKIQIDGPEGHRLSARLALPADGQVRACALFAHCFTCSKDLRPVRNITRALTQAGIAVLRFDFTGHGESEGDFEDATFSSNIEDLVAVAAYMEAHLSAPAILIGHSLGGTAVLAAAERIASVRAVATIAAPFDPRHVTSLFRERVPEIETDGEAEVEIAGRTFTVSRHFLRDVEEHRMEQVLGDLRLPVLFFHSPVDAVVGIDNAARLYQAAKHPKSFVSLDDADHLLLEERDSRYVGDVLAAWASRYLEARPERSQSTEALKEETQVSARTEAGSYVTQILARGHALLADEPIAVGGSDLGPTPYDLLAAALGACTTMTLRMYADRKDWPLEEASVRLRHRKLHARDEQECEHREARMDELQREVTLEGPLTEEQRARLMEIADRCPVHRTLSAGVVIETREAPADL